MSKTQPTEAVVDIGEVYSTRGAEDRLNRDDVDEALDRHSVGDWGNVDAEDWKANDDSLVSGHRLLSSYVDRNQVKFWIITEADRSITTVLLPEEY